MTDNDAACCAEPSTNNERFDLAVVGAGSAGFSAAITAAELGARVALVGHGTIGGTCVNVGCVPSKTLIRATEALHQAGAAGRFAGIRGRASLDDWRRLVAQKEELVASLRQAKYIDLLPAYNTISYIDGPVRLTPEGVAVNGSVLRADKVIVATGASAQPPAIAGIDDVPYLTSTTAMALADLPASLLVIGAGFVGTELAQMFARAGVAVTIVCRSRLLPQTEPEISDALAGYFRQEGITVVTGAAYSAIRQTARGLALALTVDGRAETIRAAAALVACGRKANTAGLGLTDAGVELMANGGIRVDDRLRTTNAKIYAAGDVTGRHQFVYRAAYGAKLAAENALAGDARRYDATAMPSVAFTDPQVAGVGLTEQAAGRQGLAVKCAVLPLA